MGTEWGNILTGAGKGSGFLSQVLSSLGMKSAPDFLLNTLMPGFLGAGNVVDTVSGIFDMLFGGSKAEDDPSYKLLKNLEDREREAWANREKALPDRTWNMSDAALQGRQRGLGAENINVGRRIAGDYTTANMAQRGMGLGETSNLFANARASSDAMKDIYSAESQLTNELGKRYVGNDYAYMNLLPSLWGNENQLARTLTSARASGQESDPFFDYWSFFNKNSAQTGRKNAFNWWNRNFPFGVKMSNLF